MKRTAALLLSFCAVAAAQTSFNLTEAFGLTWPDQIIEFPFNSSTPAGGWSAWKLLGPSSTEVPYQWVSTCQTGYAGTNGCIAVRSNLPSGSNYTWTLSSGAPSASQTNPVVVTGPHNVTYGATTISVYDVTNGLTGFRILASQSSPWNQAPLQGILLADQTTWTGYDAVGSAPNLLKQSSGCGFVNTSDQFTKTTCNNTIGYTATVVDQGAMKTTIKGVYTYNRPQYSYSNNNFQLSGATNASPIVLTSAGGTVTADPTCQAISNASTGFKQGGSCNTAWWTNAVWAGLMDGTAVTSSGFLGNTAANQTIAYVKTSGYSLGQFALYQDAALTTPVAGNGAFSGCNTQCKVSQIVNPASTGAPCNVVSYGSDPTCGHFTFTATLYANSKSVLIDEDTDMNQAYFIPLKTALNFDTARFRSYGTGVHSWVPAACGYDASLTVSGVTNATPVVVTTSNADTTPGGMQNGQYSYIKGIGGTVADGFYYLKLTGYTQGAGQQFGLYTDSGLTSAYAGLGAYTSGGTVKPSYLGVNFSSFRGDGFLDVNFGATTWPSYKCTANGSNVITAYGAGADAYPVASIDQQPIYSELYQASGTSTSPIVGLYLGRFSQQYNSSIGLLPGMYSNTSPDGGYEVPNLMVTPTSTTATYSHRNYGIFVSTQADLASVNSLQPIITEKEMLNGINLSHIAGYQTSYSDPAGGWKYMGLQPSSVAALKAKLTDPSTGAAFYAAQKAAVTSSDIAGTALLTMWHDEGNSNNGTDPNGAVGTALSSATTLARTLVNSLMNDENRYGLYQYWHFGFSGLNAFVPVVNAILCDLNATGTQKATAKALLAFPAAVVWDNDWMPWDNYMGNSTGTANMGVQYNNYRQLTAMAAPSQPFLASKATTALTSAQATLAAKYDAQAGGRASTHYQDTYTVGLEFSAYALQQYGLWTNAFSSALWANYGNWEQSLNTPPEPRFGNLRKRYANGAGSTELNYRLGQMGTGLASAFPAISGNLMWSASQQTTTPYYYDPNGITSTIKSDPTLPTIKPNMFSANFPGYHTNERHGFGTNYETSLWFINGAIYSDHRDSDDGQVTIYADNAPLAIDFSPNLYNPLVDGRWMHNSIVFDSERSGNWNDDNTSVTDVELLLHNQANTEFVSLGSSTHSTGTFQESDGTVWTRNVRTMAFDPEFPVIYVKDTFSGTSATAAKTLTWNLMAAGAVTTPAGSITPVGRYSQGCEGTPGQLPSNEGGGTPVAHTLGSGLQAFTFTGQAWPTHFAGGINWYLYLVPADTTTQFFIGQWGHGCHGTGEMSQFTAANTASAGSLPGTCNVGQSELVSGTYSVCTSPNTWSTQMSTSGGFNELQYILRVHDSGASSNFSTFMLPWPKTATYSPTVSSQTCGTQIVNGSETTCFNDSTASFTDGTNTILSTYDGTSITGASVTLSGGQSEARITPTAIYWQISGKTAASATITVPAGWKTNGGPVSQASQTFTYTWAGGLQATPQLIVFSQFTGAKSVAAPPAWIGVF